MLVITLRRRLDIEMIQQLLRVPRIFASDQICLAKDTQSAQCNVLEIPDWCSNNVESGGEWREIIREFIIA